MQNHWILRIQRRLIYAYNDAFDTVIIVDILIVSNIYTGFWGMPCLHWNHTFGKVAIDFGDVFFILKSILYLIFLRVLLWAILWTPGIVFLFLFSLFKTATANGWVVTVPFRSYSVHVSCRQVLRLEPNNEAARRELEKMEEFLPDLGERSRGGWR